MPKITLAVLAVASLFCIGYAYDPLPGDWRLIDKGWRHDDTGAVLHTDYDSTAGVYAGYLKVVPPSLAAKGWAVGDTPWRDITFDQQYPDGEPQYRGGSTVFYSGSVRYHQVRQMTPDIKRLVEVDYQCKLVVFRAPDTTVLRVNRDDCCLEVWIKLEPEHRTKDASTDMEHEGKY
jgi:hypothetical protein